MKLRYEIGHYVARLFLKLTGWHVAGGMPAAPRRVVIAAPHTSNWDFVYLLAAAMVLREPIYWLGKKELFTPPFGWFMRGLGGISVDRSTSTNLVDQVAGRIRAQDSMSVVIPPSGTRSSAPHWRSGFYWIARQAQAEIVCGYLDYAKREAGLGYHFAPSGDVQADMSAVREFYAPIQGKFPERNTPVRLKEEDG